MLIVGKFADLRLQVPGAQCEPSMGPGKTRAGFWSSGTSPLGTEASLAGSLGHSLPVPTQAPQPEGSGESSGAKDSWVWNGTWLCHLRAAPLCADW